MQLFWRVVLALAGITLISVGFLLPDSDAWLVTCIGAFLTVGVVVFTILERKQLRLADKIGTYFLGTFAIFMIMGSFVAYARTSPIVMKRIENHFTGENREEDSMGFAATR